MSEGYVYVFIKMTVDNRGLANEIGGMCIHERLISSEQWWKKNFTTYLYNCEGILHWIWAQNWKEKKNVSEDPFFLFLQKWDKNNCCL